MIHKTKPVQVWIDVDVGIADFVEALQAIPGVRTEASCQGTLGEGGASPYPANVLVSWTGEMPAQLACYRPEVLREGLAYVFPEFVVDPHCGPPWWMQSEAEPLTKVVAL